MKKRTLMIVCGALLVGALGWTALSALSSRDSSISVPLWRQIKKGTDTTVDFATIAPFAWDRVFIFGPYTSSQEVDRRLGFHWSEYWQTNIDKFEGYNLVLFVREAKVARWFEHPRNQGELEGLAEAKNGFARGDAKFRVQRTSDGRLALGR